MIFRLLLIMMLVLTIGGCATTGGRIKIEKDVRIQQLNTEIDELNRELEERERKISSLETQLQSTERKKVDFAKTEKVKKTSTATAFKINPINIQKALKNSGYYNGPVDGNIGKNTKRAIRNFQKANGLTADGVVGRGTWAKLKSYLRK